MHTVHGRKQYVHAGDLSSAELFNRGLLEYMYDTKLNKLGRIYEQFIIIANNHPEMFRFELPSGNTNRPTIVMAIDNSNATSRSPRGPRYPRDRTWMCR